MTETDRFLALVAALFTVFIVVLAFAPLFITVDASVVTGTARPAYIAVQVYDNASNPVTVWNVPVPRDRFAHYFRAFEVARAVNIGEANFDRKITVMDGLIPREVFVCINAEENFPPAIWFELYVSGARYFSEPLTQSDARLPR